MTEMQLIESLNRLRDREALLSRICGEGIEEMLCVRRDPKIPLPSRSAREQIVCDDLNFKAEVIDGTIQLTSIRLTPGTMVFFGLALDGPQRKNWTVTRPTPFNRAFQKALSLTPMQARAERLLELAKCLSSAPLKQSLLDEAAASARQLLGSEPRQRLLREIAEQFDAPNQAEPSPAAEPLETEQGYDGPDHYGRFVLLRQGVGEEGSVGRLPAFPLHGGQWYAYHKRVHFVAEAEVAPYLLACSLKEAKTCDPQSLPQWRNWVENQLPANPFLRQRLLTVL